MNAAAMPFVPTVEKDPSDQSPDGVLLPTMGSSGEVVGEVNNESGISGTPLWRPRYHGRIRSFNEQKGFGFIDCQETFRAFKRDVFIHRFQMVESGCGVGQDVEFEVEVKKSGFPQARRVMLLNVAEASMGWDFDATGLGSAAFGGMAGGMGARGYGMPNYSYRESQGGTGSRGGGDDPHGNSETIEDLLRKCTGSTGMWELIEQYGHHFGKKHVVTALYQLGLCRQYERRMMHASLTSALVDRLVRCPPREIAADEASKVLWALAMLEEVRDNANAHSLAIELGEEAAKRYNEFSPAQMATLVNSLSRLVRAPEEDELVAKITTNFSDYALGGGALPRFPPEELRTWTNFLQEVSSPFPSQQPQAYPYGGASSGWGGCNLGMGPGGGPMGYGQQYNAMAGGALWPGQGPCGKGGPGGKQGGMRSMASKGGGAAGCSPGCGYGGWGGGPQGMGYPQGKCGGGKGPKPDGYGGGPCGGRYGAPFGGYGGGELQGGTAGSRGYSSRGMGHRAGSPSGQGGRGQPGAGPRTRSPGGGGGKGGGFRPMGDRSGSGGPQQRFAVQSAGPPRMPGLQEAGGKSTKGGQASSDRRGGKGGGGSGPQGPGPAAPFGTAPQAGALQATDAPPPAATPAPADAAGDEWQTEPL